MLVSLRLLAGERVVVAAVGVYKSAIYLIDDLTIQRFSVHVHLSFHGPTRNLTSSPLSVAVRGGACGTRVPTRVIGVGVSGKHGHAPQQRVLDRGGPVWLKICVEMNVCKPPFSPHSQSRTKARWSGGRA